MYSLRLSPATIRPSAPRSIRRLTPILKISFCRSSSRSRRAFTISARMSEAADVYARALSEVAQEQDLLDSILADLETVEQVFSDPDTEDYFTNPTVDADEKHALIDEAVKASDFKEQTANFLRVLVDNNRMDIIPDIVRDFEKYYNQMTSTEMALVTSVVKLEEEDLAQIAKEIQRITGVKNVRIKTEIDESLVGGFTIRYCQGSKLIDMSVRSQLDEIASTLKMPDAISV